MERSSFLLKVSLLGVLCFALLFSFLIFANPLLAQERSTEETTTLSSSQNTLSDLHIGPFTITSLLTLLRLLGAAIGAIGLLIFLWGFIEYILSEQNEHHKLEGRVYMGWGAMVVIFFFCLWAAVRLLLWLL